MKLELLRSEIDKVAQALVVFSENRVKPFTQAILIGKNLEEIESLFNKINKEDEKLKKMYFKCNESGELIVSDSGTIEIKDPESMEKYAKEAKELMSEKFTIDLQLLDYKSINNAYECETSTIKPIDLLNGKLIIKERE